MKRRELLLSASALSPIMFSLLLSERQKAHLAGSKCAENNCSYCGNIEWKETIKE